MRARELAFRRAHRSALRRVGSILRSLREEAQLRQVDVAGRLGRSQSYVAKYESGERRLDLFELREACTAIGVSLAEVVARFDTHSGR